MSLDPKEINDRRINEDSRKAQLDSLKADVVELEERNINERLGLPPVLRVSMLAGAAVLLGGIGGLAHGWQTASLKYLASNSHRLPTIYNGWFFYHKRKMYYCLKQAMTLGFKTGGKLGLFVGFMFGIEAALDKSRGVLDFGNTMMGVCIPGFFYAWWHRMPRVQARDFIRKGGRLGITFGLAEDFLQYARGADLWYLSRLGVQPKRLTDRIRELIDAESLRETK
ncbi:DEKNAAC103060 [Brettanomyces naardenensis]|uniref:DEKNAAC103060 n=1 Tax=Brettanomyces naardenensis TaxID=13370 RepID=A0A448YMK8_BRENA|nr:DEKNAAC103060 [Brettanomyces naardenensis]